MRTIELEFAVVNKTTYNNCFGAGINPVACGLQLSGNGRVGIPTTDKHNGSY